MDGMLSFFYEFFGQFLGGIWTAISNIFVGIVEMFNFSKYVSIVDSHTSELGGMAWVYAIIGMLVIIGLLVLIGYRDGSARAVCDFLSCMTDRYASRQFQKLFVPAGFAQY